MEHIASVDGGYNPDAGDAIGDMYHSEGTAAAARTAAGSTIEVNVTIFAQIKREISVLQPPRDQALIFASQKAPFREQSDPRP